MTTEEINKYIHEQIMDRCWHEVRPQARDEHNLHWNPACHKCGRFAVDNLDYCSDESPRSLLNEVVAKVVENTPFPYMYALERIAQDRGTLFASAEQIARACVEAHKNQ